MQIFEYLFYIHSGNLVAFAENDTLKLIWLDNMIKIIQFINIQNGMLFIKLTKNQKFWAIDDLIEVKAIIQSALNAIYGQITKLKTVMGTKIIKYSFSVAVRELKVTCIFQNT